MGNPTPNPELDADIEAVRDDPTPEEERAAERNEVDPDVARRNKEAMERGANVQGEGQIEP